VKGDDALAEGNSRVAASQKDLDACVAFDAIIPTRPRRGCTGRGYTMVPNKRQGGGNIEESVFSLLDDRIATGHRDFNARKRLTQVR